MSKKKHAITPPRSDAGYEQSLKVSAMKQAQEHLESGKASSQIINAVLSMNTEKDALQLEEMRLKNELLKAKIEETKTASRIEELVEGVHAALKQYTGAY